jgi:hypothetical protein
MRTANLKPKLTLNLFLIGLILGLFIIEPSAAAEKNKDGTRIIISTSGPAEFKSYWLDAPPRLVIEFQTRNIVSKIDNEVIVDQGAVRRVTSEYFEEGENRSLKSLTFELLQKEPYKIWQERDTVILDIQAPIEISVFPQEGKEIFAKNGTKDALIKRLEAMDAALTKVSVREPSLETPNVIAEFPKARRKSMNIAFWFIGLALISGSGLMLWLFWRRYRLQSLKLDYKKKINFWNTKSLFAKQ